VSFRRNLLLTGAALALLLPTLSSARASGPAPLDTPADLSAALNLESRIADHIHFGQVHEQLYGTPARTTGNIATLVGEYDSALYTGNYLAGQAFRYALAKQKLTAGPSAFWTAQKNEAKSRVDAMAAEYHILSNISKNWKTTFNPQLRSDRGPTDDGYIDFGGGVFQGEPGLLFRACNPIDAPAPLNVGRDPNRGGLVGPLAWDDGKQYYCLDNTSRDAYAGTTFGLATAFDLVGGDDPALQTMIGRDLMTLAGFAQKYLWNTPRPHGSVVLPLAFGGNDLSNFISPLFVYTPMAQMNLAQVARHAAHVVGTPVDQAKWEAVWALELLTELPQLAGSMQLDAAQPHDGYYKFHLNFITGFNLIRLEPDPTIREEMRRAIGAMDATTYDDVNALYEAVTYALTGETSRLNDAVTHHRQWLDYKARLDASANKTHNSPRCGVTLACVYQDRIDLVIPLPTGGRITLTQPGSTGQRAAKPLAVAERKGADFLWQKDPTILDGDQDATWEPPGADFLVSYWMIRYYSEAAVPALKPLPAWPGASVS
jgi:hypothetical protein